MRTAVDSNVILDVLTGDPAHAPRSKAALRAAAHAGALVVCECVVAEIRPALAPGEMEQFLVDWRLLFVPSTRQSCLLAGEMFAAYLKRRAGTIRRVPADFLVGAHAFLPARRPPAHARSRLLPRVLQEAGGRRARLRATRVRPGLIHVTG